MKWFACSQLFHTLHAFSIEIVALLQTILLKKKRIIQALR